MKKIKSWGDRIRDYRLTKEDWRDLHNTIERFVKRVEKRKRLTEKEEGESQNE